LAAEGVDGAAGLGVELVDGLVVAVLDVLGAAAAPAMPAAATPAAMRTVTIVAPSSLENGHLVDLLTVVPIGLCRPSWGRAYRAS